MGRNNVSFSGRDAFEAAFPDCCDQCLFGVGYTGRGAESMGAEMDDKLLGTGRLDDVIIIGMGQRRDG
jgi:hypothetical protein